MPFVLKILLSRETWQLPLPPIGPPKPFFRDPMIDPKLAGTLAFFLNPPQKLSLSRDSHVTPLKNFAILLTIISSLLMQLPTRAVLRPSNFPPTFFQISLFPP